MRDVQLRDVAAFVRDVTVEDAARSLPIVPGSPVRGPSGGGDFLSCVRDRESGGDYTVHNFGGSGAAGAYQIMPGTWDAVAAASDRSDLVGVDPAAASPADQDAMAAQLYADRGGAPWGGAC